MALSSADKEQAQSIADNDCRFCTCLGIFTDGDMTCALHYHQEEGEADIVLVSRNPYDEDIHYVDELAQEYRMPAAYYEAIRRWKELQEELNAATH